MDYCLNGNWSLRCCETGETIPARVPGDVTADFFAAGKIPDPYFGMNYKDERWLLERDYEYSLRFSARLPEAGERIALVFSGIDTFAEIRLNGVKLGETENMFLRYEYDVTKLLAEENELCVHMRSTLKRMEEIDAERYFACFNKERIFIRKAQCHFGWDWAPDLPGYGIWGDVTLSYLPEMGIAEVRYRADREGNVTIFAELNYSVRKEEYARFASDRLRYTLERAPGAGLDEGLVLEAPVSGAKNFRSFRLEKPALWMPIGYGKPWMYAYKVELIRDGRSIDCFGGRLGIREIELVQTPVAADRMSFRLKINGADVFVKGSNWAPCECFTGTADDGRYEKLIGMAVAAGVNMLRVWGGGIYEKDIFYRLCDEAGIMVWQDFMFACADIPETDEKFVANVAEECVYQIKRLRNHPSIVYWCGGNEKTGSCGLMKQYGDNLVDVTIRGLVGHYDGTRPYVRQSPYSLTDVGNDPESGETHGTAFDITEQDTYEEFVRASFDREVSFASECAVMGSCVSESYRDFVPEEKLWPLGEIQEDRFCDNPYGPQMSFVNRQLKAVEIMFGKAEDIDDFAEKSMAVQAEVLNLEILNARRRRAVCGGFMNWMFDDIWPTGTWSIVDYYLRPKAGYYAIKREYAPFRAAVIPDGRGKLFGWLLNDTDRDLRVKLRIGGVTLDGVYEAEETREVIAGAYSATELGELRVSSRADAAYIFYEAEEFCGTATAFTKLFKELPFSSDYTAEIGISAKAEKGYKTIVCINAVRYARMVRLVLPDGAYAEDNWFDVLPGQRCAVAVFSDRPLRKEEISVTDFASVREESRRNKKV